MDGETHGGGGGVKGRKYDVSETNVGGIGTALDKAIREAAAGHEEAWASINKNKVGLTVWRIEKFLVKAWDRSKYGKFYDGDSYIILNTHHKATHSGKGKGAIAWDIHFWIGSESSQDEYGTAAYKTVELDDFLEGKATQYRETEGNESRAFKKLFKSITIMPGGIDSGFNKVGKVSYPKRLLHVKGKMGNVTVKKVPLTWTSINRGDCFVLDSGGPDEDYPVGNTDGMMLMLLQGDSAAPMEKMKAAGIAQGIDDDRGGKPDRQTFHIGQDARELNDFWVELGSRPGPGEHLKTAEEGGDDADVNAASGAEGTRRLMQVSDESGNISMTCLAEGEKIARSMVHSKDVFILDDGFDIMVWIGREASITERRKAMSFGQTYLNKYGLPADKCIIKLMDGGENEMFEQAFEVGVMSLKRPGEDGVKFGGGIDKIRGLQKTKAASSSVSATYEGSGGPGVATDFDEIYRAPNADPAAWKGRVKKESQYSKEMQAASAGAYSKASGWVSSLSKEELAQRLGKVQALEEKYMKEGGKDGGAEHAGGSNTLVSAGTEPSLSHGTTGFNAEQDAIALHDAMKGIGTRKEPIIQALCCKTLGQRLEIRKTYDTKYADEGTLMDTFDAEWAINGDFLRLLKVLVRDPYERDANFAYKAMKSLRADTTILIEVLCTQESAELLKIGEAYALLAKGHNFVDDLTKEFSGVGKKETQELFTSLAKGSRPVAGPIDLALAKKDAETLYEAGEKKMIGANQMEFVKILANRSFGQVVALIDAYKGVSKKKWTLQKAIQKKCSGTVKAALKAILAVAQDPTAFWCGRINKAFEGIDHTTSLIRTMVSRAEVDLSTIEALYGSNYGHPLQEDLGKDSSKPFLKMLRQIVEGNATGDSEA